jgi:hypothetical protein
MIIRLRFQRLRRSADMPRKRGGLSTMRKSDRGTCHPPIIVDVAMNEK